MPVQHADVDLQSWEKKLAHFDLGEKVTPFLQHNVGQSHVVRSLGGSSNMRASMMGLGERLR